MKITTEHIKINGELNLYLERRKYYLFGFILIIVIENIKRF